MFSQQWDDAAVVNPADITITLEEEEVEEKSKSTSSGSTLIDSSCSPQEGKKLVPPVALQQKQDLSQELFDEDSRDIMTLTERPAAPIPLSNFPHYYFEEHQEYPHVPSISKQEQAAFCQGLSQPTHTSPPKSRHGKSLTDLTGSNISLTSSQQYLSQSIADFQHMLDSHRYSESPRQIRDKRHIQQQQQQQQQQHEYRFRPLHTQQMQLMASDSHLNKSSKSHVPGLKSSMLAALSGVTEEEEQQRRRRHRSGQLSQARSQQTPQRTPQKNAQLQQRHLKATMVQPSEEKMKKAMGSSSRNKRYI